MKSKFISHLFLGIFSLLILQSCSNEDAYFPGGDGDPILDNFSTLDELINSENIVNDTLWFSTTEDDFVTGSSGLTINMPAGSCTSTAVTEIPDSLIIVLKEFPTLSRMFWGNVQTESNQEMLVTGGSFWWKVIDAAGNDYQLTSTANVTATMPVNLNMGSYRDAAAYFTGQYVNANSQQVMNWTLSQRGEGFFEGNNVFNIAGLQLGWANCDAFYDYPGDRTQIRALLNSGDVTIADGEEMVIMFVDDFPSVINLYTRDGEYFTSHANEILVGLTGTLVGVALDENSNLYFGSTPFTVVGDDEYSIDLVEGTAAELASLVNQASN